MASNLNEVAVYIRRSKKKDEHQRDDIRNWLQHNDLQIDDVKLYPEDGSGTTEERSQFRQLIGNSENDKYADVVVLV